MLSYFFKRILLLLPILFVVATLVFFLVHLSPGDPIDFILGENADVKQRQTLVENYGLDQPLLVQYKNYLLKLLQGDLRRSIHREESVAKLIAQHYLPTVELALTSLFFALIFSFPLGICAAVYKNSLTDKAISFFSLIGFAVPNFYLGPLLAIIFSISLDWLPISGRELSGSVVLPALTLGLSMAALLTRMVRASLSEVLSQDYVRTARAKGVAPFYVIMKHGLKNALLPVVTIIGLQLGVLLTGTVVTEKIFSWPGLGSLMLDGINRRDYPVVQGCILVIAATYVLVNLLTDMLLVFLDPRLKLQK